VEHGALGFDNFEGRLDAADELPEIPFRFEPRQGDLPFLKIILQAELERSGPEAKREKE